jgi:hypothetical protein
MADRDIRITTTLAVLTAVTAAVISYRHADELVRSHGESRSGHRRHYRRQPGARLGARPHRCPRQRLARRGARRLHELCMLVIRPAHKSATEPTTKRRESPPAPVREYKEPSAPPNAPTLEHAVRARHKAGTSQRATSRELGIDRRKVKRIIDEAVYRRKRIPAALWAGSLLCYNSPT